MSDKSSVVIKDNDSNIIFKIDGELSFDKDFFTRFELKEYIPFITVIGKFGSGKSFLIRSLINHANEHKTLEKFPESDDGFLPFTRDIRGYFSKKQDAVYIDTPGIGWKSAYAESPAPIKTMDIELPRLMCNSSDIIILTFIGSPTQTGDIIDLLEPYTEQKASRKILPSLIIVFMLNSAKTNNIEKTTFFWKQANEAVSKKFLEHFRNIAVICIPTEKLDPEVFEDQITELSKYIDSELIAIKNNDKTINDKIIEIKAYLQKP